ncbi:MAG: molybdate ABC transporter permease subunit, partial [Clostridium sp.]
MGMDYSPLWISVKTSLLATFVTLFLGVIAAYFIANSKSRFKGVIDGLFTLPLILPPTVIGFFLLL